MKNFKFTVQGQMPSLNELIHAAMKQKRGYSPYNKMKKEMQEIVITGINESSQLPCLKPVFTRVHIIFTYYEKNKRRDPDNIAAGAHKFILDAMVDQEMIKNDTGEFVDSWTDVFKYDKNRPRIEVEVVELC